MELDMAGWETKYKPIKNTLVEGASFQDETGIGIMFETYGEEVAFVKQQDPNKVWTYVDEDGEGFIVAGWHFINRLGYFITEEPWTDEWETISLGRG